ncbi:hypothetical protein OBBRIDRAFT_409278 [Obba rivulosa]|uniref:Uncharacterized protein n=1 Tax=Obba rivulosa TaxID=1052685 RepID=A0A8E2AJ84_9APHY|nr:hypothetical protein OBBRIDRAFT_409278 [Obba rivulosa]
MNCIQMVLWVTDKFQMFSIFIAPITSIVISRLILTLRCIHISTHRASFWDMHDSNLSFALSARFTSVHLEGSGIVPDDILDADEACENLKDSQDRKAHTLRPPSKYQCSSP